MSVVGSPVRVAAELPKFESQELVRSIRQRMPSGTGFLFSFAGLASPPRADEVLEVERVAELASNAVS